MTLPSAVARRVLITGAGGQLAGAIKEVFAGSELRMADHRALDITDAIAVERVVDAFAPTLIVNCAAYNQVDEAELNPQAALNVNAFGVRVLARAAAQHQATFVHYSSDFVFDGKAGRPYTEDDLPNPLSAYGASKLLGEWFAREAPTAYVLRVASLFGGSQAKSSVDRIVDALVAGREAKVFVDRTASPSYVVDVASATRALVERGSPGLYHCVGSGSCTWQELAMEAAKLLDAHDAKLVPIRAAELPLAASRPQYAALLNQKLAAVFAMPTWKDALERDIQVKRNKEEGKRNRETLP